MATVFLFMVLMAILAIGDVVSAWTKAYIPSVFTCAVLIIGSFWSGLMPKDMANLVGLGAPLINVCMTMLIVHMGSMLSISEMRAQWRTVVTAVFGLVGLAICLLVFATQVIGWDPVVVGAPPLSGGIVAALMMSEAATQKGLIEMGVLAMVILFVQGFVGNPLTAVLLKKEAKRLSAVWRAGGPELDALIAEAGEVKKEVAEGKEHEKKKLIHIPEKYSTQCTNFFRVALVGWCAQYVGAQLKAGIAAIDPAWAVYSLHPLIIALIFGVVAAELGIIERGALNKTLSFGFFMINLRIFSYGGQHRTTPEMLTGMIGDVVVVVAFGVAGLLIAAWLISKVLKGSTHMSMAVCLTALYGFPGTYILSDEATKAVAETPEEKQFLMDMILPKMLVGGFVTVTIASVFLAGIFVNLL